MHNNILPYTRTKEKTKIVPRVKLDQSSILSIFVQTSFFFKTSTALRLCSSCTNKHSRYYCLLMQVLPLYYVSFIVPPDCIEFNHGLYTPLFGSCSSKLLPKESYSSYIEKRTSTLSLKYTPLSFKIKCNIQVDMYSDYTLR